MFHVVSIHALLAECDLWTFPSWRKKSRFNPRTPCGVRRGKPVSGHVVPGFNPRTPCGVRPMPSITWRVGKMFQSTHSLRSATVPRAPENVISRVSIHALLAECDIQNKKLVDNLASFNPRTPCGVRLTAASGFSPCPPFQSTHSLRSATPVAYTQVPRTGVSIHALLAECDSQVATAFISYLPFQSTHSLRSATTPKIPPGQSSSGFQSTHSLRSATSC